MTFKLRRGVALLEVTGVSSCCWWHCLASCCCMAAACRIAACLTARLDSFLTLFGVVVDCGVVGSTESGLLMLAWSCGLLSG